jgi:hypothetical protein
MKSIRRPLYALCLAAFAAVLAPGCVDNNATLFIQQVIAPAPPDCVYEPDPGGTFLGSGAIDVGLRTNYVAGLLVGNQYTPRGDKDNLRAETTRVRLQGAEIRLTDTEGNRYIPDFSVYGSGTVNPGSGEEAGFGAFVAELIPSSVGETLLAELDGTPNTRTVIANVKVFGETTGGQEIESAEFTFPITACWGCLVAFPADAVGPEVGTNAPVCNQNVDKAAEAPCRLGQDARVDCRLCSGRDICFYVNTAPPP